MHVGQATQTSTSDVNVSETNDTFPLISCCRTFGFLQGG